jgi:hypothetical protein
MVAGCATAPFAATTNRRIEREQQVPSTVLDVSDHQLIRQTMLDAAGDRTVSERPRAAEFGVRWSDVQMALAEACYEEGVEMAVVSVQEHEWGYAFDLRTVEDRPAGLVVTRRPPPEVYHVAAWVGRFRDDPERAARLIEAFDRQLRQFGAKPQFDEEPSPPP